MSGKIEHQAPPRSRSTIRANGIIGGRRRRIHSAQPCPAGVSKKIWTSDTWSAPLEAQIAALRVDEKTAAAIVDALRQPDPPVTPIDRGHLERRRRQLALDMAAGRIEERTFLTTMRRLKEQEAAADVEQATRPPVDAARALDYVRNFAAAWAKAKPPTRATMMQAVYESVTVRGEEFVSVRLTDEAYAHGFAVALPQEVRIAPPLARGRPRKHVVLARPTGVGSALTAYGMPVEGRDEWLAAVRRLA